MKTDEPREKASGGKGRRLWGPALASPSAVPLEEPVHLLLPGLQTPHWGQTGAVAAYRLSPPTVTRSLGCDIISEAFHGR